MELNYQLNPISNKTTEYVTEADSAITLLGRALLPKAAELARSGRYSEAECLLQHLVQEGSELPAVFDLLARIRAQQGRLLEAQSYWADAIQLSNAKDFYRAALKRIERLQTGPPWLGRIRPLSIGLGLIFKSKATSGGTDIIAMILNKYTRIQVGQLLIIVDSIIVLAGFIAFEDWRIPFYSWIIIYLTGRVIDMIIEGVSYEKACLIISDKTEEIKNKILLDLDRSGNLIPIKGLYSGNDKQMIMTVVNRREVEMLKSYIRQIDPQAFMTVVDASEVIGQGFKNIND